MTNRTPEVRYTDSHFTGNNGYVHFETPAPFAAGLTSRRLEVGYRLADIFEAVVKDKTTEAKDACASDGECRMKSFMSDDDSGNISAVKFNCPGVSDKCRDTEDKAASTILAEIERITRNVLQVVDQQAVTEVVVTVNRPQPTAVSL